MRITVLDRTQNVFPVDIAPTAKVDELKAMLANVTGIPAASQHLSLFGGSEITNGNLTLSDAGVSENSMVLVSQKTPVAPAPAIQPDALSSMLGSLARGIRVPGNAGANAVAAQQSREDAEFIKLRDHFRSDPYTLSVLKTNNPAMAEAVLGDDLEKFKAIMKEQQRMKQEAKAKEMEMMRRAEQNPFDVEAQRYLEEKIQMENVIANRNEAVEHNPEVFGQVHMLYINCEVNGVPVKAFVDSGAQMTIMNDQCARRCNLLHLVDRAFAGTALGVGSAKIMGRVHRAQLKVGDSFLTTAFSVMENQSIEMLLGLDMLKRHQCCIDLAKGVLRIGTTSAETPFLSENEIPLSERHQEIPPETPTSTSATTTTTVSTTAAAESATINESVVTELMQTTGMTRDVVLQALQASNGDPNLAAQLLFPQ